ncbi:MAG: PEP-CTERM sorting domain-containing protein [Planctomycetaceae bacterium]|jgi:hypothetical protein|nr:PEP-CTERM sorting domain-containing protein [Planctomycetaceae bacterium]
MKTLTNFTVAAFAFAVVLSISSVSFADTYTLEFDTSDTWVDNWKASNVIRPANYVNPTSKNDKITAVGTRFNVGWLQDLAYNDVKRTSKPSAWTTDGAGWISPLTSGDAGHNINGFVAYQFSLFSDTDTALNGSLSAIGTCDDYITAIYLNGQAIYYNQLEKGDFANPKTGDWQAISFIKDFENIIIDAGLNDFVIIVHNTNAASNDIKNGALFPNSVGLNMSFSFESDYEMTPPPVNPVTPEPATMLIVGLGIAGLGLVRRWK